MTEHSIDEIFDDASGDIAVGDLESAVAKYRRCVEMAPHFFDGRQIFRIHRWSDG